MKTPQLFFLPFFFLFTFYSAASSSLPRAGFFLPDSVNEISLPFKMIKNLIVLPVTINDSVEVNLILDTGCRNLILFGKKFKKIFSVSPGRPVQFSGLGNGQPVTGGVSLGNKVSINAVLGEHIPVVIVGDKNVFNTYYNIHGVIGYDIFVKFEIELNALAKTIIFRPAAKGQTPSGFAKVPLQIVDARPLISSHLFLDAHTNRMYELMIDTGSSLGLLLKTTDISKFEHHRNKQVIGIGFNGPISGYQTVSDKLMLTGFEFNSVPTGIVSSDWHDNGSIGMAVLKDYIVILNYCKAYACFKRNVV